MNLMPMIAKALDVEIGEEFKIDNDDITVYCIKPSYVFARNIAEKKHQTSEFAAVSFINLLCGHHKLIKITYKPEEDDQYWYAYTDAAGHLDAATDKWHGTIEDYMRYRTGNCFRSRPETCLKAHGNFEKMRVEAAADAKTNS